MASTIGYVQGLIIGSSGFTCISIGPSKTNATLLAVQIASSDSLDIIVGKSSIVDALTIAMASGQQVEASHGNSDPYITGLIVGPE